MNRQMVAEQVRKTLTILREKNQDGKLSYFVRKYIKQLNNLEGAGKVHNYLKGTTNTFYKKARPSGENRLIALGWEANETENLMTLFVTDKQSVIKKIRKVLKTLREKNKDGACAEYVRKYETQLDELEHAEFIHNYIRGIYYDLYHNHTELYEGESDPFLHELADAEDALKVYLHLHPEAGDAYGEVPEKDPRTMLVTVDGSKIHSYKDFVRVMQQELQFPRDCEGKADRYLDWIRDLSWFDYDRYVFTIQNTQQMMQNSEHDAKAIIDHFYRMIIPFWDHKYKHCIVCGMRKDIILNLE